MEEGLGFDVTLVVAAATLIVGACVTLVILVMSSALDTIPQEDRQYKDPPPPGFRIVWWPIQWISYVLDTLISAKAKAAMQTRLRQAGLDFSLSPAQFYASRILCAAMTAALFWFVLGSFDQPGPADPGLSIKTYLQTSLAGALAGWLYPAIWLKDRLGARKRELMKTLPFYLDIVTLCVEAGLNMQGAMTQAVAKGPKGVLRDEFQRVLRDIRAGKGRAASLRDMAERLNQPAVTNFTTAVIQAESMGMNLGPVLRAQAEQRRTERFLRAEKLAMEAPVKMLFPLIAFIFPCTFIVLFFPIVMKFMNAGL